jgi:hypothetical protein
MGMGQFFPSGYGYGFVCPLGTLPTAIPRSHTDGLGTPYWCTRDPDPMEGVSAAGLANRHAAIIEGRQRGQDRHPQAWVITEP